LSGNTIVAQGGSTLAFTSTATNGFSVDGTTLSVDAANNRIGVGTSTPLAPLHISATTTSDHLRMTNSASDWALASENAGAQNGISGQASLTIVDRANTVRRMTIGADNSFRLGGNIATGNSALSIDGPTNKVGIGTNTPQATLDIKAGSNGSVAEGLIAPRLTGTQLQGFTYTSSQTGAIVYVTAAPATPAGQTANVTAAGYYFFDGSTWQKIMSGSVANGDLAAGVGGIYKGSGALSGNTTVTQGGNTLTFTSTATNGFSVDGTTLSVDAANNAVGIGTAAPNTNAALDISSTTKGVKLPSLALAATNNASPLSGHVAGMLVYNTATAGTAPNNVVPGLYTNDGTQWILLQTPQTVNVSAPAGTVSYTAANTVPAGYLECNGAAVSRTTYATLFAAIGTTYGTGDGSTTFNLPDLRGEFVRGWDHGRGVDVSRTLGSTQAATRITVGGDLALAPYGNPQTGLQLAWSNSRPYSNVICNDNGEDLKSRTDAFTNTPGAGSYTTNQTWYNWPARPRNISLMPIIKY